jgi:hypothetical protein
MTIGKPLFARCAVNKCRIGKQLEWVAEEPSYNTILKNIRD